MAAGGAHPAYGASRKRFADAKAGNVAVPPRHAPAHVGIDGQPQIAHQKLAGTGQGKFDLGDLEIGRPGDAFGKSAQADFAAFHAVNSARARPRAET